MKPEKLTRLALAFILAVFLPTALMACGDDIGSGGAITTESSRDAAKTNCNYDDNLDLTADQFLSKCVKGYVRRRFPAPYFDKTLREIEGDNSKDGKTAKKLLKREEYRK